jgi:hypothetical protein
MDCKIHAPSLHRKIYIVNNISFNEIALIKIGSQSCLENSFCELRANKDIAGCNCSCIFDFHNLTYNVKVPPDKEISNVDTIINLIDNFECEIPIKFFMWEYLRLLHNPSYRVFALSYMNLIEFAWNNKDNPKETILFFKKERLKSDYYATDDLHIEKFYNEYREKFLEIG